MELNIVFAFPCVPEDLVRTKGRIASCHGSVMTCWHHKWVRVWTHNVNKELKMAATKKWGDEKGEGSECHVRSDMYYMLIYNNTW